ncbi:MAG TPA: glycosyltransferase family 4 protein [Candidatus Methylomirabilis sp.]|nr:glycosyltransferase family 4 protein [Candidatus Methylomirabilis sp.]
MNIVHVGNYRPQIGGAAISCDQLMVAFARRACRVRVLASMTREAEAETRAFDATRPDLGMRRFVVPFYFNEPYLAPPREWEEATRAGVESELERMIAESRPDALVVREGWVPYSNAVAERHAIPTLALVRGNPTSAILSGTFPAELGEAFLGELRKAAAIVTVARHFLPGLKRLGFENVRSIPNAVDAASFAPRERNRALSARLAIGDSDLVVLHAAQIKSVKRPLDIVRSAAEVLRRDPKVLYLIVGEGPLREDMERLAGHLGVRGRFRFEPFVDYERMPDYMNLADVVLMPSEREGLARVYLEAQACARTLIASDIAAAREVVIHGQTGLLFRRADLEDMIEQTLLAAGDSLLRERLGMAAREQVLRCHDVDTIAGQYLALIRDIVQGHRERASRGGAARLHG